MGKGEIARYEQFLLFPQCFQKACFPVASKAVIVWELVKTLSLEVVLHCQVVMQGTHDLDIPGSSLAGYPLHWVFLLECPWARNSKALALYWWSLGNAWTYELSLWNDWFIVENGVNVQSVNQRRICNMSDINKTAVSVIIYHYGWYNVVRGIRVIIVERGIKGHYLKKKTPKPWTRIKAIFYAKLHPFVSTRIKELDPLEPSR